MGKRGMISECSRREWSGAPDRGGWALDLHHSQQCNDNDTNLLTPTKVHFTRNVSASHHILYCNTQNTPIHTQITPKQSFAPNPVCSSTQLTYYAPHVQDIERFERRIQTSTCPPVSQSAVQKSPSRSSSAQNHWCPATANVMLV